MDSWIRHSYAGRLYLWLLIYSLLLVGCCVIFQYEREKEFKAAELNSQLQLINNYISSELADGKSPSEIRIGELKPVGEIRVSIVDSDGQVVYDNSLDHLPHSSHRDRKEIAEALRYGTGYTLRRHSESTGSTYFYSATRTPGGMIIRTAVPYTLSLDQILEADYTFLWIMGGVAIIFCLTGFVATRRVGQHIIRLSKFAASAERGERITDTEPFPHDELGDISNHIVRLYARLQQAITDRDREHASAMHQQQEKERIKKQLTNNINHELKTPVASIQVCVETLLAHENMDTPKRREFLERCLANAGRLKRLLADVALITRMDDGGKVIIQGPVDLTEIIAAVAEDSRPGADAKGILIENTIGTPLPMTGNPDLLESVFRNLIENAVAYSGGSLISLKIVALQPDKVTLSVSDNGCGVPPEHIGHLFERFYRIDKGRSRASGGTGLGLSIVRNAIVLHKGSIRVANRAAGGLDFTISLPLRHE